MSAESTGRGLRVGYVPGVTLTKWRRVWAERYREPLSVVEVDEAAPLEGLRDGSLDMCVARLPIERDGLHAITLYEEQLVAWVAKDHVVAAADEVTLADLDGETVLTSVAAGAVDRVLAGAVLLVPMSIARGASRRDLTYRPVVDAEPSPVALVWRRDDDNPLLEEFVGVVRGRTANSSRSAQAKVGSTRGGASTGSTGSTRPAGPGRPARSTRPAGKRRRGR